MPIEVGSHQLIIVASGLDASTERIVSYLTDYGVPVNAVFFRYFNDSGREYIARSWLLDPLEAEGRARRAFDPAHRRHETSMTATSGYVEGAWPH